MRQMEGGKNEKYEQHQTLQNNTYFHLGHRTLDFVT